eukprot:1097583-Rhodomonas_salina.2
MSAFFCQNMSLKYSLWPQVWRAWTMFMESVRTVSGWSGFAPEMAKYMAANEAVLKRTSTEIKRIRMGFLGTQATRALIDMAVVPVFRYTAGIAVFRRSTGNAITKRWWSAHVAAIELPNGVSRTLLLV